MTNREGIAKLTKMLTELQEKLNDGFSRLDKNRIASFFIDIKPDGLCFWLNVNIFLCNMIFAKSINKHIFKIRICFCI